MYDFSYILSIISDTFRLTLRVLHDVATVSLAMERRRFAPWDLGGGEAGSVGRNTLIRAGGETRDLGSWGEVDVGVGEQVPDLWQGNYRAWSPRIAGVMNAEVFVGRQQALERP
jgi:hypothetical protein